MPANRSSARFQAQVTVAKLLTFAYEQDEGFVTSIQRTGGPFTLNVNQFGEVELSGEAGNLNFTLDQNQRAEIGHNLRWMNVQFGAGESGALAYTLSAQIGAMNLSFSGLVDLRELIKQCRGLLCIAARVINADTRYNEAAIKGFR